MLDTSMLDGKKAVIFDMDGTLMDSMWIWRDIDIEYLGQFGLEIPDNLQTDIEGMGFTETAVYFKEQFHLPMSIDEIEQDWNRMAFEKYEKEVFFKPGARELILELKKQGIKMGIATSNHIDLVMAALRCNHAEEMFDCIVTAGEVPKGKPSPDVYLAAAERLQVKPEQCLVFEDVPMGILAGKNAGMMVCAVEDPYSGDQDEKIREFADYYIRDFRQVLDGTFELL